MGVAPLLELGRNSHPAPLSLLQPPCSRTDEKHRLLWGPAAVQEVGGSLGNSGSIQCLQEPLGSHSLGTAWWHIGAGMGRVQSLEMSRYVPYFPASHPGTFWGKYGNLKQPPTQVCSL